MQTKVVTFNPLSAILQFFIVPDFKSYVCVCFSSLKSRMLCEVLLSSLWFLFVIFWVETISVWLFLSMFYQDRAIYHWGDGWEMALFLWLTCMTHSYFWGPVCSVNTQCSLGHEKDQLLNAVLFRRHSFTSFIQKKHTLCEVLCNWCQFGRVCI